MPGAIQLGSSASSTTQRTHSVEKQTIPGASEVEKQLVAFILNNLRSSAANVQGMFEKGGQRLESELLRSLSAFTGTFIRQAAAAGAKSNMPYNSTVNTILSGANMQQLSTIGNAMGSYYGSMPTHILAARSDFLQQLRGMAAMMLQERGMNVTRVADSTSTSTTKGSDFGYKQLV